MDTETEQVRQEARQAVAITGAALAILSKSSTNSRGVILRVEERARPRGAAQRLGLTRCALIPWLGPMALWLATTQCIRNRRRRGKQLQLC